MRTLVVAVISLILFAGCAATPQVPQAARSELAATGKLRAGINLANTLLAAKDPTTGNLRGVAVDLANELGKRIAASVVIVGYASPGQLADAAKADEWDVAFLAADPTRASVISFTPPYAEIEATYLVPKDSLLRSIAEVDREGVRIAVAGKTAIDLYLSRTLRNAKLVRGQLTPGAFKIFVTDRLEALAALRPALLEYAEKLPGSRVLEGRFTTIEQAIGTPGGRLAATAYLRDFVNEMKTSGFVARAIEGHGIRGLSVASNPGSAQ